MIIHNDCKTALRELIEQNIFVDSIVTDPPYELGFMGKDWDKSGIAYDVELWQLCLHVLKPGGHLLAFGGSRTYHRMACAIEDAGFEIRDQILWIYGSGFPKSLDVSKAIDKAAGAEREIVATRKMHDIRANNLMEASQGLQKGIMQYHVTQPATNDAQTWQGWGSALKPAHEPIVLARKPLSEKTIASNVLKFGTGAINIDGCRVGIEIIKTSGKNGFKSWQEMKAGFTSSNEGLNNYHQGRFPANLIHDGSEEVEAEFAKYGERRGSQSRPEYDYKRNANNLGFKTNLPIEGYKDNGTASRFFYCAKASKSERQGSKHPTVKPLALMRYLCRLVTRPGGIVLDPFAGTGTTGQAAQLEGMMPILIEKEQEYIADIEKRLKEQCRPSSTDA